MTAPVELLPPIAPVLLALRPRDQRSLPRDELLEMRRSPPRRQRQARLQRIVGLDHLIQEDGDGSRVRDDVMELQKDNVVIASAKEMQAAQRTFLDVERLVGLGLQRSRKFVAQVASCRLSLYNSAATTSARVRRRHSGRQTADLMAQNETLHGLVEIVGVEMRPEREAGREPIGRIGRIETIDEPQRFLADRHVQPGTVGLDGIDGARPDVGVDRLDDRGGDRQWSAVAGICRRKCDPQLDLDAIFSSNAVSASSPNSCRGRSSSIAAGSILSTVATLRRK